MTATSLSLLAQLKQSSEDVAWNRLVRIYRPLILAWIRRYDLQDSDAEDLVQEVLLAISRDVKTFSHNGRPGAFRTWVRNILVNRLRNYWRQRNRRLTSPGGQEIDQRLTELDDPAGQMTMVWNREHDEHVLRELLRVVEPQFEPQTWQAFCKVTLQGQKAKEVAGELKISLNSVFIAKSRVLSRLRQEAEGVVESSSINLPDR